MPELNEEVVRRGGEAKEGGRREKVERRRIKNVIKIVRKTRGWNLVLADYWIETKAWWGYGYSCWEKRRIGGYWLIIGVN